MAVLYAYFIECTHADRAIGHFPGKPEFS